MEIMLIEVVATLAIFLVAFTGVIFAVLSYVRKGMDKSIEELEKRLNLRFDAVDKRLDAIEKRLDAIEERHSDIEGRLLDIERPVSA